MRPESPGTIITERMIRPSIKEWSEGLPEDAQSLIDYSNKLYPHLLSCADQVNSLLRTMKQHSQAVEPVDRALGRDPLKRHAGAFQNGGFLGIVMAGPLIIARPKAIDYAAQSADVLLRSELNKLRHDDEVEQADMRGRWLMNKGGEGRAMFDEAEPALDKLTDVFTYDVSLGLYVKAGAGLMLGLVWEGYKRAEEMEMMHLGETMLAGCEELDQELAMFLGEDY